MSDVYEWPGGDKLRTVIDDVRTQISDDGHLYTDTFLVSAINSAIKLIAWEEDARDFFKYHLQTELASINKDGTPAARWTFSLPGTYNGKKYMNFIDLKHCYGCLAPCYLPEERFFQCCAFPENECPGQPCTYTLEQMGDKTTLILDRPPSSLVAVDAMIYIIPQDITTKNETIPLGPAYREALTELVKIIINKEQDSFDQARMRYEDYDKHIRDIIQGMAMRRMEDQLIVVNGGLD